MNERGILKTGAVVVAVAVALLLVPAAETGWVRPLCAAAFCLLVPGYGWARRMHLKDKGDTLALSAVFSICATVAVGTVMAVGRWWSPWTGFAALLPITLCGFIPLRRTERRAAMIPKRVFGGIWNSRPKHRNQTFGPGTKPAKNAD